MEQETEVLDIYCYDDAKAIIQSIQRLATETGCTECQAAWAISYKLTNSVPPLDVWFNNTDALDVSAIFERSWDKAIGRAKERSILRDKEIAKKIVEVLTNEA